MKKGDISFQKIIVWPADYEPPPPCQLHPPRHARWHRCTPPHPQQSHHSPSPETYIITKIRSLDPSNITSNPYRYVSYYYSFYYYSVTNLSPVVILFLDHSCISICAIYVLVFVFALLLYLFLSRGPEGPPWGPKGPQGARRAPIWWPKATSPPQELERGSRSDPNF